MAKRKKQQSRSKPRTSHENSTSEDVNQNLTPQKDGENVYERERALRIEENRARMQALGLPKMAASLARNTGEETESKGKEKLRVKDEEDDEDYKPDLDGGDGDEDELDSLGFEDEDDDEDYATGRRSKARSSAKANKRSRAKKKVSVPKAKQKLMEYVESLDEDEALKMAIALSLEDPEEASSRIDGGSPVNARSSQQTGKKGKKSNTNRVQMNEDDVVIHFCQFDEAGKGNINVRDLKKMAVAHDFTWSDKELMDMIRCFDSDGDGKLTFEDFRGIITRLNMLKAPEE